MNLFKKSFIGVSILFLFVLGLTLIPHNKASATIPVSVTAEYAATSVQITSGAAVPVGTEIIVRWSSSGANSCSNNFNSVTTTTGLYQYTANTKRTFTVNCTNVNDAPSPSCSSYYLTNNGSTTSCTITNYLEGSGACNSGYTSVCFNGDVACFLTSCKPNFNYYPCSVCCYSRTQDGVCIRDYSGGCGSVQGSCAQR